MGLYIAVNITRCMYATETIKYRLCVLSNLKIGQSSFAHTLNAIGQASVRRVLEEYVVEFDSLLDRDIGPEAADNVRAAPELV